MSRPQLSKTNLTGGGGTASPGGSKPGWGSPRPGGAGGKSAATAPSSSSTSGGASPSIGNSNAGAGAAPIDLTPYLGLPLQLSLVNSSEPATGLLFAHDASTGLVILETDSQTHASSSRQPYPPQAAAAPTTRRTQAVNAAQGGESQRPPTAFKLIKERLIKDVKVLDSTGSTKQLSPVTPVNVAVAEKREMAASREAAVRASRIGVGVTENGQDVFEALSKTLPCRWHEKHIIVMDEVVLSEPYDVASLRVPKYTSTLLEKLVDDSTSDDALTAELPSGESLSAARGKARSWQRVGRVLDGERRKIAARRAAAGQGL